MVIPRSRSNSMESSTCSAISLSLRPPADLNQTVRDRGLAVVDMGNYGKITDMLQISHRKRKAKKRNIPKGGSVGIKFSPMIPEIAAPSKQSLPNNDPAPLDQGNSCRLSCLLR